MTHPLLDFFLAEARRDAATWPFQPDTIDVGGTESHIFRSLELGYPWGKVSRYCDLREMVADNLYVLREFVRPEDVARFDPEGLLKESWRFASYDPALDQILGLTPAPVRRRWWQRHSSWAFPGEVNEEAIRAAVPISGERVRALIVALGLAG